MGGNSVIWADIYMYMITEADKNKIVEMLCARDAATVELGLMLADGQGWDIAGEYDLAAWDKLGVKLGDIFYIFKYLSVKELHGYGNIPATVGKMQHLRSLTVNNQGRFQDEIWKLNKLEVLELKDNNLRELPEELGSFERLYDLILTGNEFERIPLVISKLRKLQRLHLSNNKIKYIPHYICNLPLTELYLNNNEIEHLPSDIGKLSGLRKLFLKGNKIRQFPSSMSKLKSLRMLLLIGNPIKKLEKKRLEEMLPNCHIHYGY